MHSGRGKISTTIIRPCSHCGHWCSEFPCRRAARNPPPDLHLHPDRPSLGRSGSVLVYPRVNTVSAEAISKLAHPVLVIPRIVAVTDKQLRYVQAEVYSIAGFDSRRGPADPDVFGTRRPNAASDKPALRQPHDSNQPVSALNAHFGYGWQRLSEPITRREPPHRHRRSDERYTRSCNNPSGPFQNLQGGFMTA